MGRRRRGRDPIVIRHLNRKFYAISLDENFKSYMDPAQKQDCGKGYPMGLRLRPYIRLL